GALCYDAGLSVNMDYGPSGAIGGSGANGLAPADALKNTFSYSSAVKGYDSNSGPGQPIPIAMNNSYTGLLGMINPNLDAGYPVILGLVRYGLDGKTQVAGHEIVCDGYGFNLQVRYHHLNMGWGGVDDLWYSLDTIETTPDYDAVYQCVYNIRPTGTGEMVSGRVTGLNGIPIAGVQVSASVDPPPPPPTIPLPVRDSTNDRGIYAFRDSFFNQFLGSNTSYIVCAGRSGYFFQPHPQSLYTT
ncbi:unnamed protein product, partial [marine sediment metagenome]